MLHDGIPLGVIKTGIEKAFRDHKPKHPRDRIRTLSYCVPICYAEWERNKTITAGVPSPPVALGSSRRPAKSRNQLQLDELDKLIEEGEKVESG